MSRTEINSYYFARNFGNQMGVRVILLDDGGRVTVDSFGESWLEGRVLQHNEINKTLAGQSTAGEPCLNPLVFAETPSGRLRPANRPRHPFPRPQMVSEILLP
ncbi:MAG: hypothetical protein AB1426_00725 [Bacillota bacterium]